MRRIGRIIAGLTLAVTAAAALAPAANAAPKAVYSINGTAVADASATGLQIQVTGATRNALRVLDIGDSLNVSANAATRWVVVSGLTPSQGTPDDIDAGDSVTVTIRAARNASLATLEATAAGRVTDVTARVRPDGRLYLYDATVTGVDTTAKTISVTVRDGNLWGLRSMLGAPVAETFAYGDATVFVKGSSHGPVLISAGAIGANDRVAIRAFAAPWTAVATIAAAPAAHVRLVTDAP